MTATADNAATFRRLHAGKIPLLLANAWDAGSARLIEDLGAPAIATTSAGVAWSHGYPDGDALPVDRLLATVAAIARVVRIPLSVDIEGGYAADPARVAATVERIVDAGAVGINLEDGSGAPELLAAKIAAAKQAGVRRGVDLFVNARTDVYLRGLVAEPARVAETVARAARYRDAGADGVFVPGIVEPAAIRSIAERTSLPLNVLARPGLPSLAELAALGVRRLSAGSAIAQIVWERTAAVAAAFLRDGDSTAVSAGCMPYAQINALLVAERSTSQRSPE